MHRFVRSLSGLTTLLLLGSAAVLQLDAGGPLGAFGSTPIVWDIEANGPIRLLLDRGSMAQHDSAATYDMLLQSTEAWDTISGSTLRIGFDGYLPRDVRTATDPVLVGAGTLSDGVVPVVIDDDGSITDAYIGVGANRSVNGFATPFTEDGRTWTDGRVVMNGSRNRNENGLVQTMTHELGHLIGISHNQRNHRADYALMNPFGGGLDHEDILALLRLYPEEGALDGRGTISGRITDAGGRPISGVNLLAVNSQTGEAYSTLSDYFAGGDFRFQGPSVPRTGAYSFEGLPPGTYYIRMEGIDPEWDGGSSVASYDPPINTGLIDDWYNGQDESGAMHLDNLNRKTGVTVGSGQIVSGIDFVENDRTGLTPMEDVPTGTSHVWGTPNTFQGVQIGGYAVRHVAPHAGAPVMTRIWIGTWPNVQDDGNLVVTVYNNRREQGFDLPGTVVGELVIPPDQIVANLNYDIWLHEIAGVRFNNGDVFHIGFRVDGPGRIDLEFVEGEQNAGTSFYNRSEETWMPFPILGNNNGERAGELKIETWFSPIRPGDNRVLIAGNPTSINFGNTEVGQVATEDLVIVNIGTAPMEIETVALTGADRNAFRFDTAALLGRTLQPGDRLVATVSYRPVDEGSATATLSIAGLITLPIPLSGVGTSPAVGQLAAEIPFGQTMIGEARSIDTVVIYNRGTVALVAQRGGISGTGFRLLKPSSDGFFRPGDSLTVVVEFNPTEERSYDEEMIFTFRPPRDTIRIRVTGEGVQEITGVPVVSPVDIGLTLEVVPNPATDALHVTIDYPAGESLSAFLVDPLGRVVARPDIAMGRDRYNQVDLSIASLPSGTYRLVIMTEKGSVVEPVSIVR